MSLSKHRGDLYVLWTSALIHLYATSEQVKLQEFYLLMNLTHYVGGITLKGSKQKGVTHSRSLNIRVQAVQWKLPQKPLIKKLKIKVQREVVKVVIKTAKKKKVQKQTSELVYRAFLCFRRD